MAKGASVDTMMELYPWAFGYPPWVQLGVWGFSFGLGYWGVSYCTCGPGYNNMGPHGYNSQLANMIGTGSQYAVGSEDLLRGLVVARAAFSLSTRAAASPHRESILERLVEIITKK